MDWDELSKLSGEVVVTCNTIIEKLNVYQEEATMQRLNSFLNILSESAEKVKEFIKVRKNQSAELLSHIHNITEHGAIESDELKIHQVKKLAEIIEGM